MDDPSPFRSIAKEPFLFACLTSSGDVWLSFVWLSTLELIILIHIQFFDFTNMRDFWLNMVDACAVDFWLHEGTSHHRLARAI
jgi:hypothetical protein